MKNINDKYEEKTNFFNSLDISNNLVENVEDSTYFDMLKSRFFYKIDFNKTPLLFIKKDGDIAFIEANPEDVKHLNGFINLIKKYNDDFTDKIFRYISDNKRSLTGFDISKYLVAEESCIAVFHTDIANYFNNIKSSTIIIPTKLTEIQAQKLYTLINYCSDFDFHLGISYKKPKKEKIYYQRLYDIIRNKEYGIKRSR